MFRQKKILLLSNWLYIDVSVIIAGTAGRFTTLPPQVRVYYNSRGKLF